jgi:hypothetical protein
MIPANNIAIPINIQTGTFCIAKAMAEAKPAIKMLTDSMK